MTPSELEAYNKSLSDAMEKYALPSVPVMPISSVKLGKRRMAKQVRRNRDFFAYLTHFQNQTGVRPDENTGHNEKVAPAGYVSPEYFNMVHTPVKNWTAIPKAREAVDLEMKKLQDKKAWLLDKVREYDSVKAEATRLKNNVHFGDLMRLCHVKHSELDAKYQSYKGRVVSMG